MSGGPGDEFDELVLDESFVQGGRREASAEERAVTLARIAREHGSDTGWRSGPTVLTTAPRRERRERRGRMQSVVLGLSIVGVVALSLAWLEGLGGDRTVLVDDAAAQAAQEPAAEAPSAAPSPPPARLVPLPPAPAGEGGFRFLATQDDDSGRAVAFDPCRPVSYVVRRAGEVSGGDALIEEAVAEVGRATGLQFVRGADTDEPLSDHRRDEQPERYGPGPAPVLIAWSDEVVSPDLAGYITGVAGPTGAGTDQPGSGRFVGGEVLLDTEDLGEILDTPGGSARVRATILHELGHLVGLAHVSDPAELMYSEGGTATGFGPGDLRGLHALGSGTCFVDY